MKKGFLVRYRKNGKLRAYFQITFKKALQDMEDLKGHYITIIEFEDQVEVEFEVDIITSGS